MSEPRFRGDIAVKCVQHCGGDRVIAEAAWVLDPDEPTPEGSRDGDPWTRVIKAMLKGRHGTPFEHGLLTVYVEAPVVVWWEWTRHRFMSLGCPDLGFNLESGRYKVLDGEFYLPPNERPILEPTDFRPMRPRLVSDDELADEARYSMKAQSFRTWACYQDMIGRGIAREAARLVLPFNVYYAGYVSANPRTWLSFFSLRRSDPRAAAATFPQWEIQQADEQCEAIFARHWPVTYELFNRGGRVAPGA